MTIHLKTKFLILIFPFLLLTTTEIFADQECSYTFRITRIGDNLYEIDNTPLRIQTINCNQFPSGEEVVITTAILNGNFVNLITFKNTSKCEIVRTFKQ